MNNTELIRRSITEIKNKINKFNLCAAILIGAGISLVFVFILFFYFADKESYEY